MQYTDETNFGVSKRNRFISAAIFMLSVISIILGITFIKINRNYNTYLNNSLVLDDIVDVKHIQTKAIGRAMALDSVYVKIGGRPIGISVNAGGLIVIGQNEVVTDSGNVNPAAQSGLQTGDVIVSINGESLTSIYQLKRILDNTDKSVTLEVSRNGNLFEATVLPATDRLTGQKKLGLLLKEDMGGVGTLTFVTNDGKFGALGHYIVDAESGLSDELDSGNIYATSVDGVIKGERGQAGGLVADVNRLSPPIGNIKENTQIGIFGDYVEDYDGALFRIADKGEAKIGPAKVYTTIEGTQPKFYDIDIVKVISQSEAGEKGMVISVRDRELLEKTGGIVQGMSGSPIVQDGILIGAVTHVFVQDPTRGYAVHSRFMYEYATDSDKAMNYEFAA